MKPYKILVVDDEEDLCEILQFNLETQGYVVDIANSSEEALEKDLSIYDLLLLDVMMGEISGFRLARMLQQNPETSHVPIVFLTAKDTENDKLTGFNIGADDFISKPFSIREMLARVNAVLKRTEKSNPKKEQAQVLSHEKLKMYLNTKKVMIDNAEIPFTKKEFEIMCMFLGNKNRVFSRDEILSNVWTNDVCVLDRTIDVNITRIRKKIGTYGKNIVTRLGYGYSFEG